MLQGCRGSPPPPMPMGPETDPPHQWVRPPAPPVGVGMGGLDPALIETTISCSIPVGRDLSLCALHLCLQNQYW